MYLHYSDSVQTAFNMNIKLCSGVLFITYMLILQCSSIRLCGGKLVDLMITLCTDQDMYPSTGYEKETSNTILGAKPDRLPSLPPVVKTKEEKYGMAVRHMRSIVDECCHKACDLQYIRDQYCA